MPIFPNLWILKSWRLFCIPGLNDSQLINCEKGSNVDSRNSSALTVTKKELRDTSEALFSVFCLLSDRHYFAVKTQLLNHRRYFCT